MSIGFNPNSGNTENIKLGTDNVYYQGNKALSNDIVQAMLQGKDAIKMSEDETKATRMTDEELYGDYNPENGVPTNEF